VWYISWIFCVACIGYSESVGAATDSSDLRAAVTLAGVQTHRAKFQAIADANGGTRWDGSPGHLKSVEYVSGLMVAAGYQVTIQEFTYDGFFELQPGILQQLAPTPKTYTPNDPSGFYTFTYSGSGDVTATTQAVDTTSPDSGCDVSDFAAFTPGNIAVMKRGGCTFQLKAQNAQAAGASAVIIYNDGLPGRTDANRGTLTSPSGVTIPAVSTGFNDGVELGAGVTARVFVNAATQRTSRNVIAESPDGRDDLVLVVGAHLDSVKDGPGINSNGSGAAAVLEIALKMSTLAIMPSNKLRFIWWGAGEQGFAGALHYVGSLTPAERSSIGFVVNFDGIGSPNFVRFVYDGDGSDAGPPGPPGSAFIEEVFRNYFDNVAGLPTEPIGLDTPSDHLPFVYENIPVGGLFTGTTGIKTANQVAVFGGTAGDQYDPCYGLACDTFDNYSAQALDQMTDAAAHAVITLAMYDDRPVPVPTLGAWSIMMIVLLLGLSAATGLRSHRPGKRSSG
jgi:Zn-dependent M28 family amino/carboxypeptidase